MERSEVQIVKVDELTRGMRIHSFDGFHPRFKNMDKRTRDWVNLNFSGSQCIVARKGKKLGILVESLEEGDTLLRMYKFPNRLKKLTIVNDNLAAALKARGFLRFRVSKIKKLSPVQVKRKEDLHKTEEFFKDIEDTMPVRDEAAEVMEQLMDKTRKGETNILQLMQYVDFISEESSPEAMSIISALKQSDKTYAHSVDVGVIFQTVYTKLIEKRGIKSRFKDASEMLMGAFMHDFGNARLPKDIIDSTELFDPKGPEMKTIRKHTVLGAELLSKMRMPDYIVNMARYHHVKQDMSLTASYPEIPDYNGLSLEDRLLGIVDTYQALVGRRPYKQSWAPPGAISYMDQLAGIELDLDVWDDFASIMGRYPIGSLVELSNHYQAFVSNVNPENPDRPQVVVVSDNNGKKLSRNEFIDLEVVQDVKIKRGLDHFEIFGDRSLDMFLNLKII